MTDIAGLDSDLPQLPDPSGSSIAEVAEVAEVADVAEVVHEVNELIRHLWNAIHGLNDVESRAADEDADATRTMIRDLKREIMRSVERLPTGYARVHNSAVIAVYSLLR